MILKPRLFRKPNLGHPLARGLVGYWLFNEGSGNKVYDLSGNGNTGTFVADTQWVLGKLGLCPSFDGTEDSIDCGGNSLLVSLGNDNSYTVSSWINTINTTVDVRLSICFGNSSNNFPRIGLGLYSDHKAYFTHRDDAGTNVELRDDTGSVLNDGQVHLLTAVRYTANSYKLFVDGISVKTSSTSPGTTTLDNFQIGIWKRTGPIWGWVGKVEGAYVWNRIQSDAEIALLYREPFIMFEQTPIELWVGATSVGAPVGANPKNPLGHPLYGALAGPISF